MKRNTSLIVVSILLVALMFISAGCKASGDTASAETTVPQATVAPTTEETIGAVVMTVPESVIPAAEFDENDMFDLLEEADRILAEEDRITMRYPAVYVRAFFVFNDEVLKGNYVLEDDQLTLTCIKTPSDQRETMKFGIFLYLITSRYYGGACDFHYTYSSSSNMSKMPVMFFCPSYKELGFSTSLDCLKAIDNNEIERPDNSFYIWINDAMRISEYHVDPLSGGVVLYDYSAGDYAKD